MEPNIHLLLKEAFTHFGEGDFGAAKTRIEEAHGIDFDHPEVLDALKCCVYWEERAAYLEELPDPLSRGDFLYHEWAGFTTRFLERLSTPLDEGLYQIKRFVFGEGIKAYKSALENSGKPEAQTSLLIGRGYKSLGDYEEALRQLERAHQINKEDSEILGEMADCYDMIGNTRIAKLFFREAFYINPQGIALEFIESKIVKKIIEKLEEKELNQDLLKEWIPVYGVLYGVFNVKRELRPLEIGGLKQSIYALKNELQETKAEMSILLPRLINRYFWLIDHYLMIKEDRSRIEEVLLNIRVLDSGIYEMYTR